MLWNRFPGGRISIALCFIDIFGVRWVTKKKKKVSSPESSLLKLGSGFDKVLPRVFSLSSILLSVPRLSLGRRREPGEAVIVRR